MIQELVRNKKGQFVSPEGKKLEVIEHRLINAHSSKFTVEKEVSSKFPLSGGWFEIERVGQQEAHTGNSIEVKLGVYLPCQADRGHISEKLIFGNVVEIINVSLWGDWGKWLNYADGCREICKYFTATKWSKAFIDAREYATAELNKLEKALMERKKALEAAEYDE